MGVIGEGDSFLFTGLTPRVEVLRRAVNVGFGKVREFMGNPRAGDVLETHCLGVSNGGLDVCLERVVLEMATDGFQAAALQHLAKLSGREIVEGGQLDFGDTVRLDLVECSRNVRLEEIAQTIKLKPGDAFEAAGLSRPGRREKRQAKD